MASSQDEQDRLAGLILDATEEAISKSISDYFHSRQNIPVDSNTSIDSPQNGETSFLSTSDTTARDEREVIYDLDEDAMSQLPAHLQENMRDLRRERVRQAQVENREIPFRGPVCVSDASRARSNERDRIIQATQLRRTMDELYTQLSEVQRGGGSNDGAPRLNNQQLLSNPQDDTRDTLLQRAERLNNGVRDILIWTYIRDVNGSHDNTFIHEWAAYDQQLRIMAGLDPLPPALHSRQLDPDQQPVRIQYDTRTLVLEKASRMNSEVRDILLQTSLVNSRDYRICYNWELHGRELSRAAAEPYVVVSRELQLGNLGEVRVQGQGQGQLSDSARRVHSERLGQANTGTRQGPPQASNGTNNNNDGHSIENHTGTVHDQHQNCRSTGLSNSLNRSRMRISDNNNGTSSADDTGTHPQTRTDSNPFGQVTMGPGVASNPDSHNRRPATSGQHVQYGRPNASTTDGAGVREGQKRGNRKGSFVRRSVCGRLSRLLGCGMSER